MHVWEQVGWVRYKGHTYAGPAKVKLIAKLKSQLARIDAGANISWREKIGQS